MDPVVDRDPGLQEEAASASPKLEFIGTPQEQADLFDKIAAAVMEFKPILNDTEGMMGHRTYKYAALDTLVGATRFALSKHGICVLQCLCGPDEVGNHRLTTILAGAGAQIHAHIDYLRAKGVKEWGAQTTYLRRYAYRALFQLDGSDDADATDTNPELGQAKPAAVPSRPMPVKRGEDLVVDGQTNLDDAREAFLAECKVKFGQAGDWIILAFEEGSMLPIAKRLDCLPAYLELVEAAVKECLGRFETKPLVPIEEGPVYFVPFLMALDAAACKGGREAFVAAYKRHQKSAETLGAQELYALYGTALAKAAKIEGGKKK